MCENKWTPVNFCVKNETIFKNAMKKKVIQIETGKSVFLIHMKTNRFNSELMELSGQAFLGETEKY